jgi:hypothetical protein
VDAEKAAVLGALPVRHDLGERGDVSGERVEGRAAGLDLVELGLLVVGEAVGVAGVPAG